MVFLAFLLWSLEAEGFVIPTGSMAPTLMGRHKEVVCPQCGYTYTVNAGGEVEPTGRGARTGRRVVSGTCENCRFESAVGDMPSFTGDRIYVMKEGLSLPFFDRGGPGQAQAVGRGRLQASRRARGALHQAAGRHAQRGDPHRRRRPLGPAADASREFERLLRPLDHQQAMQIAGLR